MLGQGPAGSRFPLGAAVTLDQLDRDPHPLLANLRSREPVSWIPSLDGWLVTRYDLAAQVMRDASTFTVDDPRFSTAQVIGPSMLSLDGLEHGRHRAPFVGPFRLGEVRGRFQQTVGSEALQLVDALRPSGSAELRRAFAGPLAATIVTRALGLGADEVAPVLTWYDAIVTAVTEITAGRGITAAGQDAFGQLRGRLLAVIDGPDQSSLLAAVASGSDLSRDEIVSNAAVLLFGGIETTEGMIANAILHLLERPEQLELARTDPDRLDAALEESLRLEPAAAVVDRYATADVELDSTQIAAGDLVRVSIAAANRDPAVFADPNRFEPGRTATRGHVAFAHGPHVCLGVHLARLEARAGLAALLQGLSGLRLDPRHRPAVRGLVFRKPPALLAVWDSADA
jgi:cytochrome P450